MVRGDNDASGPIADRAADRHPDPPGALLAVYEGGPHRLYIAHRERLTRDIATFATSLRAQA